MAETNSDQVKLRAPLQPADYATKMLTEIVGQVVIQRAVVGRSPVGEQYEHPAVRADAPEALICPEQRLTVDVLLEQSLS